MITLTPLATTATPLASVASAHRTPLSKRRNYIAAGGTIEGRFSGRDE
jgi:hypothetical protein